MEIYHTKLFREYPLKVGLGIDDLSYRKNSKLDIPVSLFQELSYGAIELQFVLVWKKTKF